MEISTNTTAATSLSLPSPVPNPKSPESDPTPIEQTPPTAAVIFTPTTRIQPTKPSPLTNGVLKRHPPTITHKPDSTTTTSYKECLKNHAAAIGGHALDGCGEFMPSPNTIPTDPTSLKCAACGCHRNFHRREPEESSSPLPLTSTTHHVIEYHPHHRHHPPPPSHHNIPRSPSSQSPPPISSSYAPHHMLLALSDGAIHHHQQQQQPRHTPASYSRNLGSGRSAGPDHNSAPTAGGGGNQGRKRFRTKFTPDQKERMHEFAEKVGWKMQKCNDEMVAQFCNEVGVERGVLKVWMHNNKNTYGKRDFNGNLISSGTVEEIQHRHEEDDEKNSNEILQAETRTTPVKAAATATANCSNILTATATATTIG